MKTLGENKVRNPDKDSYPIRHSVVNPHRWQRHQSRRNVLTRKSDVGPVQVVIFMHKEDAERFLSAQKHQQVLTVTERRKAAMQGAINV